MSREDILLKEYETCQSHNNSIGSQVWVSTTIFLSINVTLLGGLLYGFLTIDASSAPRIGATVLGIGIIFILWHWIRWLKRMQFLTSINYERMREIEYKLGMWKTWMAGGLDLKYDPKRSTEWERLPKDIKNKLNKWSEHFPNKFWKRFPKYAHPRGFEGTRCIAWIVIAMWIAFIFMSFTILDC